MKAALHILSGHLKLHLNGSGAKKRLSFRKWRPLSGRRDLNAAVTDKAQPTYFSEFGIENVYIKD